jgi:hypothetical protein
MHCFSVPTYERAHTVLLKISVPLGYGQGRPKPYCLECCGVRSAFETVRARQLLAARHDRVIHSRQEDGVDDPWKLRTVLYFDRETVALSDRWASLPPGPQARTNRSVLAERILKAAAQGERDPDRVHARALMDDRPVPGVRGVPEHSVVPARAVNPRRALKAMGSGGCPRWCQESCTLAGRPKGCRCV